MAQIFLSYAREDVLQAKTIAEELEAVGWSVFWDRRIPPGQDFSVYIQQQIEEARCIVVLWSKASIASQFVRDEAAEGMDGRLVPAVIELVKPPIGFRQLQTADLAAWHRGDEEWARFVDSIVAIVQHPAKRQHIALPAQHSAPPENTTTGRPPQKAPRRTKQQGPLSASQVAEYFLGVPAPSFLVFTCFSTSLTISTFVTNALFSNPRQVSDSTLFVRIRSDRDNCRDSERKIRERTSQQIRVSR